MSKQIQIKQELMQQIVKDFKNASTNIQTINKKIETSTKSLLSNWSGNSKEAFEDEYNVLNANLGEYNEILLDMANVIEQISNTFVQQDKLLGNKM